MGTVPTGQMERELRKLYLQWLGALPAELKDVAGEISSFQARSQALIEKMGGRIASLGALGDFPAPKLLEMSPYIGKVYDQMQQAAIQAGLSVGLQSTDIARQMFNAGMDKSFRRLNRLARTETVSAYWKNQWDSTADLPLIVMVWGSESGPRTCDYCLSRDGLVVEDPSIRDHPNGRCTLIPTLRSRVQYKGTLQPDGSVDMDPNWNKPKQSTTKPVAAETVDATIGQPTPQAVDVKTFGSQVDLKTRKARIGEGDWRYIDDREQRAVTLLQNDYRAEKAVKRVAANLHKGQPAMDGVRLPTAWSKEYTRHVTDAGAKYSLDDVRDAIEDAGRWLADQDVVTPKVLYKGLDVPKDKIAKLFKEGADFDTDYSSFTTDESVARSYGGWGAKQVIVRARSTQSVKLQGNPTADHWKKTKEHLVSGKGRVVKVVDDGRTVYVDVEFG